MAETLQATQRRLHVGAAEAMRLHQLRAMLTYLALGMEQRNEGGVTVPGMPRFVLRDVREAITNVLKPRAAALTSETP